MVPPPGLANRPTGRDASRVTVEGFESSRRRHDGGRRVSLVHTRLRSANRVFSMGFSAILRMYHGYHDGPKEIKVRIA